VEHTVEVCAVGFEDEEELDGGLETTVDCDDEEDDELDGGEEVVETVVVTELEHEEFRPPPPSPHISVVSTPEGTLIAPTDQAIGSDGTVKL
jgi:hypothetical protein